MVWVSASVVVLAAGRRRRRWLVLATRGRRTNKRLRVTWGSDPNTCTVLIASPIIIIVYKINRNNNNHIVVDTIAINIEAHFEKV